MDEPMALYIYISTVPFFSSRCPGNTKKNLIFFLVFISHLFYERVNKF